MRKGVGELEILVFKAGPYGSAFPRNGGADFKQARDFPHVLLDLRATEGNYLEVVTDQLVAIQQGTRVSLSLASSQTDLGAPQEEQSASNDAFKDAFAQYVSGMFGFESEKP